jgi:hypothetical protein
MANVNLPPSQELAEITEVDYGDNGNLCNTKVISDTEGGDDESAQDNDDEASIVMLNKNPYEVLIEDADNVNNDEQTEADAEDNDEQSETETPHFEATQDSDEVLEGNNDEEVVEATEVRCSRQIRKRKAAQVINFKNWRVQGSDGVVHMQPGKKDFLYRVKVSDPTPKCSGRAQQPTCIFGSNVYHMIKRIVQINPSTFKY